MARKKKNSLHGNLAGTTLTFEVPGETAIGLHNAIVFALNHVDQLVAEGNDCSHCLKAVQAFRQYLAKVLDYSEAYKVKTRQVH